MRKSLLLFLMLTGCASTPEQQCRQYATIRIPYQSTTYTTRCDYRNVCTTTSRVNNRYYTSVDQHLFDSCVAKVSD